MRAVGASEVHMINTELQAFSISEFCKAHSISRSHFYDLEKEGRGPRTMQVGRKRLISIEAAAAWRRKMEAE